MKLSRPINCEGRYVQMSNMVLAIFFACFGFHLYCAATGKNMARFCSKPFLMPLLLLYYVTSVPSPDALIILALIFSTLGDIFLLWPTGQATFIAGLSAFLTAHVMYIITFSRSVDWTHAIPAWFFLAMVAYFAYGAVLYKKLQPYLGHMKAPFLAYSAVILTMSGMCLLMARSMGLAFILPFVGTLLFIASDSILSFDTFKGAIPRGDTYIMATYVMAQFLIVQGMLRA